MYVVAGASGQVGRATAKALISHGHKVRALVLSKPECNEWLSLGQDAAVVDFNDSSSIIGPFSDADGIFLMIPPNYNAQSGYTEARRIIASFRKAVLDTRPGRIVGLSSIGGHRQTGLGLIEQSHIFETEFSSVNIPTSFLRPAWFMENAFWQLPEATERGTLESYLSPLDRKIPMTATADIGACLASLLLDNGHQSRVVEIEGPERYSPDDLATDLSLLLETFIQAVPVPRDVWHDRFINEGSIEPSERIAMLDGFNSGWIDFEGPPVEKQIGQTPLRTVLKQLIRRFRGQ